MLVKSTQHTVYMHRLSLPPLTFPLVAMADVDKPVMPVIAEETKIIIQVSPFKAKKNMLILIESTDTPVYITVICNLIDTKIKSGFRSKTHT